MQLPKETKKTIPLHKIEELVVKENAFINNLFSIMCQPQRREEESEDDGSPKQQGRQFINSSNNKPRAKSLTELQQRLDAMKNKNNLSYQEKMLKKGIKNRLKKKNKTVERKNQKKLVKVEKLDASIVKQEVTEKPAKPVFNSDGKMVFSKFDFSDIGKKEHKKNITDPKKLLENLKKQDIKLSQLKETGEIDKAIEMKERTSWKNVIAKASGEKVRDDPHLLKKSIKKREQQHKSSKKKWEARQNTVIKGKEERQKKRQENIDKRKKTKKVNKLKKAAKKGKIIPGF